MLHSFLSELVDLLRHAGSELGITVVAELSLREFSCRFVLTEPGEEEGESRVLEEALLRHLAVFVHGLANNAEVHSQVGQERVVLVVPVREHHQLQHLCEG